MRSRVLIALLLSVTRVVAASNDGAEDLTGLSIEELLNVEVISASRLGQKANQAPSSISILTASDIRTFGWRTLADALNGMRGLFTSNNRNYTFLGVRGFIQSNDFNSRVLVMIDGQRMNENIYDSGNIAQEFMLDIDLVERIEFIPGSGSTIYGANAFLGLINVVTKKGNAINGAQLAGEVGSFDTYKGRVSYGKKLANGVDILFSASRFATAGVENLYFSAFNSPATNNGIARNMDTESADRLFGRIQYKAFTLSGGLVDRYKRVPTAEYHNQVFNAPIDHSDDRQFFGNFKYEKALNDKTSARVSGFYQGYDYHSETLYQYDNSGAVVFFDGTIGRWWGGQAQLTTTAFQRQRLIFGVEYQYDERQFLVNYDVNPYYLYQVTNRQGSRVEVFAQDDIQLLDDLTFSAGVRFDYHHMIKRLQLNPRLGLIWNPLASTTFKLLYSSTFRAPNAAELDYNSYYYGVSSMPQEELIKSYEGIVEWRSHGGIKLVGSVFYNDISKFLVSNLKDNELLTNTGSFDIYGAEWAAEKRWGSGRLLKASYTYSWVTDNRRQGSRAYGSPEMLFKLHYAEPLFDNNAKIGVENIYIDERKLFNGSFADAYDLVNVNLTSDRLIKGLDLSFGIYNLFDSHYEMLGAGINNNVLPMNGREFRFKLLFTF